MILELIEKRNKPIKTKMQFTKKEWEKVPKIVQDKIRSESEEEHETKRNIYFIYDGDLINRKYGAE